MTETQKTVVQCDFDGTITTEDVSFMILDAYADDDWRQVLEEYRQGKIPVGVFNSRAFAMVKASKQTLVDFVHKRAKASIRPGFKELLKYCSQWGFRFIIISNGLDFYVQIILKELGVKGVEVLAARTEFKPGGLAVKYIGPDGRELQDKFKEAYARRFREEGYHVVYVGNGASDLSPARYAHHIFATSDLLAQCRKLKLDCIAFDDLNEVIRGLERLLP